MRRRHHVMRRTTPGVVRRTARHVHQERILWAPILTGGAVGIAGVITGLIGPDGWIITGYTLATLLLLLGVWRGYRDDRAEQCYGIVCILTGLTWTVSCWVWGAAKAVELFWSLVFATLVLGFFWWTNDREATKVRIERERRAWPDLVAGTTLARTMLSQRKRTPVGWTATLSWHPGEYAVSSALGAAETLESLTNAPTGSITISPVGRDPNRVHVQCIETDPHAEPVPWDGRVLGSVSDPVSIGIYPDGTFDTHRWWTPGVGGFHRLLAGMTRSGKSTGMKLLICLYAPTEDSVHWMIDLKGGMALTRLAPLSDWFVTKPEPAVEMLEAALRVVEARAAESARLGWEVWQASPTHPVLIIHVDEQARLTGLQAPYRIQARALQLATDVAQLGAGVGVLFSTATQYATAEAMGSTQLREQIGWTACFRMRTPGTAQFFLPNAPKGVEPAHIPDDRKGTCYVDAMGRFRPDPMRITLPTDAQVDEVVRTWWDRTPELDPVSRDAAGESYAKRDIWTLEGVSVYDHDEDEQDQESETVESPAPVQESGADEPSLAELARLDRERMTPEERAAEVAALARVLGDRADGDRVTAKGLLVDLLRKAGPAGVRPQDAREACRMSETWVFRELRKMRERGLVEVTSDGRQAWVGPAADRAGAGSLDIPR